MSCSLVFGQLGPVDRVVLGPTFFSRKSPTTLDFDLRPHFSKPGIWDPPLEPVADAGRPDTQQTGDSVNTAQRFDDVLVSHAVMLAQTNIKAKPRLTFF